MLMFWACCIVFSWFSAIFDPLATPCYPELNSWSVQNYFLISRTVPLTYNRYKLSCNKQKNPFEIMKWHHGPCLAPGIHFGIIYEFIIYVYIVILNRADSKFAFFFDQILLQYHFERGVRGSKWRPETYILGILGVLGCCWINPHGAHQGVSLLGLMVQRRRRFFCAIFSSSAAGENCMYIL